jgi:hypothetical protein
LRRSTRGLGPQGVGSEGSISLGNGFAFALLVFLLSKMHVVSIALTETKEAPMNKTQKNSTNPSTLTIFSSLITTMWAIGTSVAAGALSARAHG